MLKLPPAPEPAGVYVLCIIIPFIASLTVAARFWVRRKRSGWLINTGADDWTVLTALILLWAICCIVIAGTAESTFGQHTYQNPITHVEDITWREHRAVKLQWVVTLLTMSSLGFIKLSVVLLYRRFFKTSTFFNIYSIVLAVVVVLWSLSFTLASVFQCGKKPSSWWTSPTTIKDFCDNTNAQSFGFCVSDILTDLLVLSAPLPIILRLRLTPLAKVGLLGVFALGLISTAAGVVRTAMLAIIDYDTTTGSRDLLAVDTNIVVWSLVEVGAAVMGACLPTIRPLFQGKSPESILGSIRSVLSLQSTRRSSLKHPGDAFGEADYNMNDDNISNLRRSRSSGGQTSIGHTSTGHTSINFSIAPSYKSDVYFPSGPNNV